MIMKTGKDNEIGAVIDDPTMDTNVLPFSRTATGGPVITDNWFLRLKPMTIFLARPRDFKGFVLNEYQKGSSRGSKSYMIIESPCTNPQFVDIDPERFAQTFELFEVLKEPE